MDKDISRDSRDSGSSTKPKAANVANKGSKDSKSSEGAKRPGRPSVGLYPEVDRGLLGGKVGTSKSAVSYILSGRFNPTFDVAVRIAGLLGITASQLNEELKAQQVKYRQRAGVAGKQAVSKSKIKTKRSKA